MKRPILLSVVMPIRDWSGDIREVIERITATVAPMVDDYEIIIVDNGSSDAEFAAYLPLLEPGGIPNLQIYRLMQKLEDDVAAWAGVENSLGDYVFVHDPLSENLSRLEDAMVASEEGYDVVFLRNTASTDRGAVQSVLGAGFRWMFRRMTGIDLARDAAPGRLMSKRVVSHVLQYPRPALRFRALPSVSGFRKLTLTYQMQRLPAANRGFFSRARNAVGLVIGNSVAPLRIVSSITFAGALLNLAYSVYVVIVALVKRDVAPGWTTLSLQQSGMFFLLSVVMFVMIEYLAHMIRWNLSGPSYSLAGEATSAVLTRRHKLNVEKPSRAPVVQQPG